MTLIILSFIFSTDPAEFIVKDAHSEELYDMELTTSLQRARARPLLKVQLVNN